GKSARVIGSLVSLLVLMKAQPLAYNKDNQEDKEPLFDAVDTLKGTLAVFAEMVPGIEPVPDAMRAAALEGFATATDLADYLVRKGVAFRDAHGIVARAVREAEGAGCELSGLPLAVLKRFSGAIGDDVYDCLSLEGSVAARDHPGGTAPRQVKAAVARARARRARP
ncbi:MAG: argininosuccinate lyase, partial [Burkholderiales bacterium]